MQDPQLLDIRLEVVIIRFFLAYAFYIRKWVIIARCLANLSGRISNQTLILTSVRVEMIKNCPIGIYDPQLLNIRQNDVIIRFSLAYSFYIRKWIIIEQCLAQGRTNFKIRKISRNNLTPSICLIDVPVSKHGKLYFQCYNAIALRLLWGKHNSITFEIVLQI